MAYLEESYTLTSNDERLDEELVVTIKKDCFANLDITLNDGTSLLIPDDLVSKFVYAINRLVNP